MIHNRAKHERSLILTPMIANSHRWVIRRAPSKTEGIYIYTIRERKREKKEMSSWRKIFLPEETSRWMLLNSSADMLSLLTGKERFSEQEETSSPFRKKAGSPEI